MSPAFSTSWAPQDVARSADRSGEFAIKALIAWLIDALDAYARELNRKPFLLQDEKVRGELDALPLSVRSRIDWLSELLALGGGVPYGLCVVAITWRNLLVHSDAENEVPVEIQELLVENAAAIRDQYQGLELTRTFASLERGQAPSLKEVTALVRAVHWFVGEADEEIRARLDLNLYFDEALRKYMSEDRIARASNVWGKGREASLKTLRQIAMQAGLSPSDELSGLNDQVLEGVASLSEIEAREIYAGNQSARPPGG